MKSSSGKKITVGGGGSTWGVKSGFASLQWLVGEMPQEVTFA